MDNKGIIKILTFNFLAMGIFNIAHPVTPTLINVLGLPTYTFGIFYSTMAIAQFVMAPIWGSISDNKGRKKILIMGLIGYGISQLGFGFSTNEWIILVFRILAGGLSVGYITVSTAYITDVSSKEDRIKYLSYNAAASSIGGSLGALVGGFIGIYGYKNAFFVQFLLSIILSLLIWLWIKETICEKNYNYKVYLGHLKLNKNLIDLKSPIGVMMVVMALITITTTSYSSSINYFLEDVASVPTTVNGIVMAIAGIIALIMNIFINPLLSKYFKDVKILITSLFVAGVSIILFTLMNGYIVLVFLSIFIASSALVTPIQQSMVSKMAKDNHGEVMGIQGSFKALGMVTGSLISGFIFDYGNKLPFVMGGLSCLIAFMICLRVKFNIED
ncbi:MULTISPECIES: MFS transporter [unclassified Romboutsia]|uniref:MFS transporter n=1 Tax=unclassified Romboutsia TaxID=2626894 RepID=UPI000820531F|nr:MULTISPECIES: MFS transporter [unclassified Romboutsia]SCH30857.1 Tetracycline resistance protein%2C class C [uncultured Clostridium sp.]